MNDDLINYYKSCVDKYGDAISIDTNKYEKADYTSIYTQGINEEINELKEENEILRTLIEQLLN